jgi:mannose-1-phosphate guanylyltransferase
VCVQCSYCIHTFGHSRRYAPGIAEVFDRIYPEFYTEREKETIEELFPACESISIDYAVMEKAERIYVLPAEFGWSDLGSWDSLHSLLPKDERNNAVVGENVRMYECNNCIVHTPHLKQAVIQGLDGYIIAEKEGTLLICRLAEEQRIKEFSKI